MSVDLRRLRGIGGISADAADEIEELRQSIRVEKDITRTIVEEHKTQRVTIARQEIELAALRETVARVREYAHVLRSRAVTRHSNSRIAAQLYAILDTALDDKEENQ